MSFKENLYPKIIQIGIQDGYCNLSCRHCYFHSALKEDEYKKHRGIMSLENFERFVDQIKLKKPSVRLYRHSEPLATPDFKGYIKIIKKHDIPVFISTNGILLDEDMAAFLIENKINNINFSIDAYSNELYSAQKNKNINIVKNAVLKLLDIRGESVDTRIGVSFVSCDYNRHEEKDFIDYWIKYVDYVKVAKEIKVYSSPGSIIKKNCSVINNEMVINFRGDVNICLFDPMNVEIMGNIFEHDIAEIWNNEKFNNVRKNFECGMQNKNLFCTKCNLPDDSEPIERIENNILIKEYNYLKYYNNLSRMSTFKIKRY